MLRRPRAVLVGSGALVALAYAFLAGPLFAWSPIKLGYQAVHHDRASVYFGVRTALPAAYNRVDGDIERLEEFYDLRLSRRMTIVVCRQWSDCHRFVPTLRGELVGAVTIEWLGDVIYVTPQVTRMGFDPGAFVRHEMSHALLLQNSTMLARRQFKRAQWLYEGVAVLTGDVDTFGTWDDAVKRIRQDPVLPMFSADPWPTPGFNIRSAYLVWAYFLDWTIQTKGRESFHRLIAGFIEHPTAAPDVYRDVYGGTLELAVTRFVEAVRAGSWSP